MILDEYKKKRTLPKHRNQPVEQEATANFFVVQKHAAAHFHYDFRLA
jgi:hypothetical protein